MALVSETRFLSDNKESMTPECRKSLKKKAMASCFVLVTGLLLILFQNFERVSLKGLKPRFTVAEARIVNPYDGSIDVRELAPPRPREWEERDAALSAGQVDQPAMTGEEWLRQQAHRLTGGADEKLVRQLNRGLNRLMYFESQDEAGEAGSPQRVTQTPEPSEVKREAGWSVLMPKSMKFTSINRLEMDFGHDTHVTCSFEGSNVRWDLVRPINSHWDMNLRHDSQDARSSLLLNYSW